MAEITETKALERVPQSQIAKHVALAGSEVLSSTSARIAYISKLKDEAENMWKTPCEIREDNRQGLAEAIAEIINEKGETEKTLILRELMCEEGKENRAFVLQIVSELIKTSDADFAARCIWLANEKDVCEIKAAIQEMDGEKLARILEKLPAIKALEVLQATNEEEVQNVLLLVSDEKVGEITKLAIFVQFRTFLYEEKKADSDEEKERKFDVAALLNAPDEIVGGMMKTSLKEPTEECEKRIGEELQELFPRPANPIAIESFPIEKYTGLFADVPASFVAEFIEQVENAPLAARALRQLDVNKAAKALYEGNIGTEETKNIMAEIEKIDSTKAALIYEGMGDWNNALRISRNGKYL